MRGADVWGLVAAVTLTGCTAARQVQPAGPDDMEAGWISYPETAAADANRALALRRLREYCGGPFTVTEERETWEFFRGGPTPMIRLEFRCGEEEEPEEEAELPEEVGRR